MVGWCPISAIINRQVEFTTLNDMRKARMTHVYPRIPCGQVRIVPNIQQRGAVITPVVALVIAAVPGYTLIVAVADVNIAFFFSIAWNTNGERRTRPT